MQPQSSDHMSEYSISILQNAFAVAAMYFPLNREEIYFLIPTFGNANLWPEPILYRILWTD